MSEFKKGDRVKVTYEGEYRENFRASGGRHSHILDLGEGFTVSVPGDATIEKLPDPLPTTPGSVVRRRTTGSDVNMPAGDRYVYRILSGADGWVTYDTTGVQSHVSRLVDDFNYEVVYDAGADK